MHQEEEGTKFIESFNMQWKPTMRFMKSLHQTLSGWNPVCLLPGMSFAWLHSLNHYMGLVLEVCIGGNSIFDFTVIIIDDWFFDNVYISSSYVLTSTAPNPDFISSIRQVVNAVFAVVDTIDYLAQFNVLFSSRDLDKWDRRSTQLWMYGLIVSDQKQKYSICLTLFL